MNKRMISVPEAFENKKKFLYELALNKSLKFYIYFHLKVSTK